MGLNNPFIRYKIYSTSSALAPDFTPPESGVRVICYIHPDEKPLLPFLEKVLSAAQISNNEFYTVFVPSGKTIFASDQKWISTVPYIFLIGVPPSSAGLQLNQTYYAVQKLSASRIIQLPALARIENDRKEKQKLWDLLKKEFVDA